MMFPWLYLRDFRLAYWHQASAEKAEMNGHSVERRVRSLWLRDALLRHDTHVEWLAESIEHLSSIDWRLLDAPVPSCPAWIVRDVLEHLASDYLAPWGMLMSAVDSTPSTRSRLGLAGFVPDAERALSLMRELDPRDSVPTPVGPMPGAQWSLHLASEVALHRRDIEEAGRGPQPLGQGRARDALAWTLDYVLPRIEADGGSRLRSICIDCPGCVARVGFGDCRASIAGTEEAVLLALWNRSRQGISFRGAADDARAWLKLIPSAVPPVAPRRSGA